jgi:hypothetical protein
MKYPIKRKGNELKLHLLRTYNQTSLRNLAALHCGNFVLPFWTITYILIHTK